MKLFSTRTHGVIDYLTSAKLLALPRVLGWSENVTRVVTGAAVGTLAYSLLTRYEFGAVKVLPVKGHLALDALNGALMCSAPLLFPDEDKSVKGALVAVGLFEIFMALTTETESTVTE